MDTIDKIIKMKADYEAEIRKCGQEVLSPLFQTFFADNPDVKVIGWTQYTPYFNDGDECIFSVHGVSFSKKEDPEGRVDYDDSEDWHYTPYEPKDHPWRLFANKFGQIPNDIMKAVFGDHVEVKATRSGFEIDEYSHD